MSERRKPQGMATPAEVAAFLGVPESRLKRWRADSNGPKWFLVGRSPRYLWADVEAYLKAQRR